MSEGHRLDNIPPEIVEHIALFAATTEFLGPPKELRSLLLTNRHIYSCLSTPHLYARVFRDKFDVASTTHRLGPDRTSPAALAAELKRRCIYLTKIRCRSDTKVLQYPIVQYDEEAVRDTLWTAYLMMLENNGKNERQLRHYAGIDEWLTEYWFDPQGASFATSSIKMDRWPPNSETNSLAMWLFWFLLKPGEC